MIEPRLDGSAVLITGATRGIGLALSEHLSARGSLVIVNSRSEEDCNALASRLGGLSIAFDVTDEVEIKRAFHELNGLLKKRENHLYGLAHCAGSMLTSPFHFTQLSGLQQMVNEHITGAFMVTQWSSKLMMRQKRGAITLLSSVVAQQGSTGQVAYTAAKAAVEGMTKSLAKELGQFGIRVNAVAPGVIDTSLIKELTVAQREEIQRATVLKRLGNPDDVAAALAFFLSNDSSFITGQILGVDGGLKLP